MSKLSALFGDPEEGWIDFSVRCGTQTLNIGASDVYPSFSVLAETLHQLFLSSGERTVPWTEEPTEYDMCFNRLGEVVTLEVLRWPDPSRSSFYEDKVFSVTGSYIEICLPFWRALRGLQGRFSEAELETRWTSPFPHRELYLLTAALGKEPKL